MPLDPQARMLIEQMAGMGLKPFDQQTVAEARASIGQLAAAAGEPEPVARVDERRVPGPAGDIPVRLYTPEGRAPYPVLVFFHGGGWVIGSLETHDPICRMLANRVGCIVASVDYRLAPEAPYPAAAEDCYAATRWVAEHAASLGGDPARIAIGGDSAGGNLTAVVGLMARDRGGPPLVFQLMVYPVTDAPGDNRSYRDNGEGYFLTTTTMRWFWQHYTAGDVARRDAYLTPLHATDVRGLPPALVITAEYDPLRDEGEAYGERLRAAGVPVQVTRYAGMIHGFFSMTGMFERAKDALAEATTALRGAFGSLAKDRSVR